MFLLISLVSIVSAQGMIRDNQQTTVYFGNLTNLYQLNDTNIPSPSNLDFLQFKTTDNKWHSYSFLLSDFWDFDYGDLINEPTIPTNNNQLTNGNGYYNSTDFSISNYALLSTLNNGTYANNWVKSGSNIYYNLGSVGIGTNNPDQLLHVQANASVISDPFLLVEDTGTTNGKEIFQLESAAASSGMRFKTTGGATTNFWDWKLGSGGEMRFDSTDGTSKFTIEKTALQYGLYLDSTGVGIGTTSPSYPLQVNGNSGGISIYASGNISATGFITRTSLFDKSKSVWDYIKDVDYYKKVDGKVDHAKYYGFVSNITTTDLSRPVNESYEEEVCNYTIENVTIEKCSWIEDIFTNCTEVIEEQSVKECYNETKIRVTYPYKKQEAGVNLDDEINLLRQAIYELKQQNDLLKSRVEVLENAK